MANNSLIPHPNFATQNYQVPAYFKGFLWFIFSGTAMLSAFILSVHIWALMNGYSMKLDSLFFKIYFSVLFFSALYHGLYRTKTILKDLKII